jgi:hypothetical protein
LQVNIEKKQKYNIAYLKFKLFSIQIMSLERKFIKQAAKDMYDSNKQNYMTKVAGVKVYPRQT